MKDEYRIVKDCLSGHIFDSSPVDFTSDLGTRFFLHPSVLKLSRPPIIATWIANGISSSLDTMFLTKFESQRAEYWQTLYSTVVSFHYFRSPPVGYFIFIFSFLMPTYNAGYRSTISNTLLRK